MSIVSVLDRATNSWLRVATLVTIACTFMFVVAPKLQESLNQEEAGSPPDLRFGYNSSELNQWYDVIGEEGCRAYKIIAALDMLVYCETYTLLFGGMLFKVARLANVNTDIALLMPVVMLCDLVETAIPLYGCFLYPEERLPVLLIQVSAAANKLKWTLFMVCNVALSFLFFTSVLKAAVKKKEKVFEKKDVAVKKKKKTAKKKD